VDELVASEGADGAAPGEYQQNPGFPSDSYIVSQALPVLALAVAGEAGQPDGAAVSFLVDQQCADGGFASLIRDDTSTDCTEDDVDATGYAVQALVAAGADAAAAKGLDWLAAAAHDTGGFGTTTTERSNANSTAVAAQALIAGHRNGHPAVRWLRHHQVLCDGKPARIGAVTFQRTYDGTAVRATSQAGAALAGKPLAWIDRTGSYRAAPTYTC
jgi:prenyltransferase beta subunit